VFFCYGLLCISAFVAHHLCGEQHDFLIGEINV